MSITYSTQIASLTSLSDNSTTGLLRSVKLKTFDDHLMSDHEFEEELSINFSQIDFRAVSDEIKTQFLQNISNYFLAVLVKFCKYIDLNDFFFKQLRVLYVATKKLEDLSL